MQRALDVALYAPAGYLLQAGEDFPAMVAKGRDRLEMQVENAKIIGRFVVDKGRRDLVHQLSRLPTPPGRGATPATPTRPEAAPQPRAVANEPTAASSSPVADQDTVPPSGGPSDAVETTGPTEPTGPIGLAGSPARSTSESHPAVANGTSRVVPFPSDRAGTAAADAAIEGYDTLSASQVVRRLDGLGADELRAVYRHEATTRGRRTILHRAQQLLGSADPPPTGSGHA